MSDYPFLGSEMIDDALGGFGALPEAPEPVDMWQRGARRVGEELGATAVPAAGILGAAGRMGVQGAREGGRLSRMFVEPAAVDPTRFVARETAAATAAGSGAAVANEIALDSQWADLLGALGGAGLYGAGLKVGTHVANTGRAVFGSKSYADDTVREAVTDAIRRRSGRPAECCGRRRYGRSGGCHWRRPEHCQHDPGYQESLADRTANPGLAALEYSRQSGPESGMFTQRCGTNTAAVDAAMNRSQPQATPGAFRSELETRRNERVGEATRQTQLAEQDFSRATANSAPTMLAEGRGANIRSALEDVSDAARDTWSAWRGSR